MIYAGRDAREVETWLSRGERMGANPAIVELNYCLLRWRDGDAASATRRFKAADVARPESGERVERGARLEAIRSFSDLTDYCCGSPACGPYLERACQSSELEVKRR